VSLGAGRDAAPIDDPNARLDGSRGAYYFAPSLNALNALGEPS
jgi:hypothetical protein